MSKRNFSTGRQGVSSVVKLNPWRAQIRHRDTETYLGSFATFDDALRAENEWRERRGIPPYNPARNTKRTA